MNASRLLSALKGVLKHPHIGAYLPYDPKDPVFLEALAAVREAEQANHTGSVELLTWQPGELSNDETTLIYMPMGKPEVWLGWHELGEWLDISGAKIDVAVRAWANLPKGPSADTVRSWLHRSAVKA